MERNDHTVSQPGTSCSSPAPPAPLLPYILEKYNTEEVKFLDVGPTQHTLRGRTLAEIFPATYDVFAAMFNSAWAQQALHMVLAAYVATGLGIAGLYAWGILRGRRDAYHRIGLTIHQLQEILDGDLAAVVDALMAHSQAEKLKASGSGRAEAASSAR